MVSSGEKLLVVELVSANNLAADWGKNRGEQVVSSSEAGSTVLVGTSDGLEEVHTWLLEVVASDRAHC